MKVMAAKGFRGARGEKRDPVTALRAERRMQESAEVRLPIIGLGWRQQSRQHHATRWTSGHNALVRTAEPIVGTIHTAVRTKTRTTNASGEARPSGLAMVVLLLFAGY
jgi:hypothetical protein